MIHTTEANFELPTPNIAFLKKMAQESPCPASLALLLLYFISTTLSTLVLSQNDTLYDVCSPFTCGNLNFSFPFYSSLSPQCGLPGFQITCEEPASMPSLLLSDRPYQVKNLFMSKSDRLITVVDAQLIKGLTTNSCQSLYNVSIPQTNPIASLGLPPLWGNAYTFYKCPLELPLSTEFTAKAVKSISCHEGFQLYLWRNRSEFDPALIINPGLSAPSECEAVLAFTSSPSYILPNGSNGSNSHNMSKLIEDLDDGFPLQWPLLDQCEFCRDSSGGRCGYDWSLKKLVCYEKSSKVKPGGWKWKLLIAGVAIGSCFLVLGGVSLVVFRKRISPFFNFKKSHSEMKQQKAEDGLNVKQFIKTYQSSLLTNYSYHDVKKMTNGFEEKLGAGGYGNVYKGKFPDGRLVAVKMIDKVNDTGHNFINEVATIGRIHHFNIIKLLGFCCDGSKRALIYEYMPNGSLGDWLSREANLSLGLVKLFEIALAVAHAIEYLHHGCELRILHLDIKPQNVLLDQNFNPKISDFGLAKVHSRNKSVVTMTGARGTIGYIAPEIFLRSLGNPSHKSDVYSYGMLLLEMVGGRNHLERTMNTSSSEAYFPDRIYNNLIEDQSNLKHDTEISLVEEEEAACIARKMAMVGLWCIQINPRDRPSMTKVLEMFSGNIETIPVPPKPFFLSPPPPVERNHIETITSTESDASELPLTYSNIHEICNSET